MLSSLQAILASIMQKLQKAQALRAEFYNKTQGNYWE